MNASESMLKSLPNLTNLGVSPVLRTALSYSPNVGAGITALSPSFEENFSEQVHEFGGAVADNNVAFGYAKVAGDNLSKFIGV